jgi:uncharacterized protein YkwD
MIVTGLTERSTDRIVGIPQKLLGRAHRTGGLVWHLVPKLFRLLILVMLPPLSVFADERASAWRTETIPLATAPPPVAQGPAAAPPRQLNVFEQQAAETIKITNEFRRRNGLPAFEDDPVCSAAAFDHAQDMARRNYFDHFGPDGSSPTSRYQRRNATRQRVIRVTENIARGNGTTPESALRMWLNSSGHRKHLVGTEMNHIGVGVANGSCFLGPCTYFVQCFSNLP